MSSPDARTTPVDGGSPDQTYLVDGQQRYRVDARLGAGGFGAVFKCWHEQTATWVAIKRVHVTDGTLGSLAHEATLLGLVDSEYVAKPRASFVDSANSLLYLVSDLADEGDLGQYLRTRPTPLPIMEAVELALGIARGLAALHAREIVHRDLKPANVLIFRRDGRVLPKLADFGLARTESSLSVADFVSPGYSAPEQLAFERAGADSDRFSFGLLLYQLLTGSEATEARDITSYATWLRELKAQPLPLPSTCRPELRDWPPLDTLVRELTQFDRSARQRIQTNSIVTTLQDARDPGVIALQAGPRLAADLPAGTPARSPSQSSAVRSVAIMTTAISLLLIASSLGGFYVVRHFRGAAATAQLTSPQQATSPASPMSLPNPKGVSHRTE
jgi:serine/threonine protein kinase